MAKFNERLKELRKKKKITQKVLAEKVGVQQGAINKWESGATEPSIDKMIQISNILESSLDYLTGNTDIDIYSNEYNEQFKKYLEEKYKKELSEDPLFYSKLVKSEHKNNSNTLETTHSKPNKIDDNEKY